MVIGITGKYCSGKNEVTRILVARGFVAVDVDKLGHRASAIKKDEIAARFGPSVVAPDGSIDRRALGAIVFAHARALRDLEAIVHPVMVQGVKDWLAEFGTERAVVNAAVLFRMGLHTLCDAVLWVKAPLIRRVRWAASRDHLSAPQIVHRLWTQRKLSPQHYRQSVDIYTVANSGDVRSLEIAVESSIRAI